MSHSALQLLTALTGAYGVTGEEDNAARVVSELMKPLSRDIRVDPMGNVLCTIVPPTPDKPHLLLEAHLDEIGMIVTQITDEGFLRVRSCGGVDRRLLPGCSVVVHTRANGESRRVPGVICCPPSRELQKAEKVLPMEDFAIDLGEDADTVKASVCPGDRVSIVSPLAQLLGNQVSAKSLDDRAGCAAVIHAVELLQNNCPCGLTAAFCTQEETGCVGARTAAYSVAPTHAVAVDVSFGYTPDARREQCGMLGQGPMVGIAPILSGPLTSRLRQLAETHSIPVQLEIMGGATSTDADVIASSRGGVSTALLSIPLKYMHTPVEVIDTTDVENCGRLLAALASALSSFAGEGGAL